MSTDATRAADQAAEAMRALNYATMPHEGAPGLEFPSDVCEVIASLRQMAERMPQALEQCAAWLEGEQRAGRVGHDQGEDAGREAQRVADYLRRVGAVASGDMLYWLAATHNRAAHLTGAAP